MSACINLSLRARRISKLNKLLAYTFHLFVWVLFCPITTYAEPSYHSTISPIPPDFRIRMQQTTWHPGCPVSPNRLAYVRLAYWGFDGKVHEGTLIVNHMLAADVVSIFRTLFQHHFKIYSMIPMEYFNGDDKAAMAANNTAAFNCRAVTSRPGEYSQHSYGRAIDINPLINPYVQGPTVLPKKGIRYQNRHTMTPGKILRNGLVYCAFTNKGWDWGGNWYDLQDYQHFEKRAHGYKRNPFGYSR